MHTNSETTGLFLQNVALHLGETLLLRIDCRIEPGTVLTVMGESGSGKSSLLDFIAGFLRPDFQASGKILLDGQDLTPLNPQERHIGLMFQSPLLFPHMSVLQNLMFAIPASVRKRSIRREMAQQALDDAGLAGFGSRDPATLSGGQQTRVALMRTLLAEPHALLLDEPFSNLDKARRADIRALVFDAAREKGLPVLLVTHDEEDATAASGKVHVLDESGPGNGCV
ncbi:putative atp-binding abc transporter protein [Roseibium aggregatum IAM 12614]|uniref:Putative atp-binding abc transporter protein n=1 Tax=Roseibium aggregatum (strain ATCC 25650 / DSM 13394 / JCM 20685 / NBRC 16684 / NCIMB 2208 / IAM 12614 / B1) TaxID=384765 RepID=A0NS53_ROSAI|nr:ATP-binding cassette domain-containing protein [Roseibium aggregatum]EAV44382.1 putative atp-binding abc transporter protein [Roseibium aggregatum IAM 12614]